MPLSAEMPAPVSQTQGPPCSAAEAIVAGRPYESLPRLAEQPHVGPSALKALVAYAGHWVE